MTAVAGGTRSKLLGDPVDRMDGPLKVSGAARYPSDVTFPGLVHAALVQSTIGAGTIRGIDASEALAAPDVLAVITHENAPALAEGPMTPLGPTPHSRSRITASCITASTWPSSWQRRPSRQPPRRD
jgi:xanthine dehydrogenase YagR molybdenum-binding subunit